ncbi:hypothetical protein GYMLUDRAFT_138510, partial [Collybiopsis luxurians FD-317 M1]
VEEVLINLPQDLKAIYSHALDKVERGKQAEDVHHLLLWLLYAFKPLNVDQVQEILAISIQKQTVKNSKGMKLRLHAIIDSSLVTVGTNNVVQFAHASVKEFLVEHYVSKQDKHIFEINELLAHDTIAQACILYLMYYGDNKNQPKKAALLDYASKFWPVHARRVEGKQQPKSSLETLSRNILADSSQVFLVWRKYHHKWGNEAVVQLFLEKGADVNVQGGEYGNALQAAVYNGNEAVVQLLLESGADINPQGNANGNALQAAARWGNEAVVQLLLEKGADINVQGGKYGNALQAAAYNGNKAAVKLLLVMGADINAYGGKYGNALQAAAYNGNEAVIKLLLEA